MLEPRALSLCFVGLILFGCGSGMPSVSVGGGLAGAAGSNADNTKWVPPGGTTKAEIVAAYTNIDLELIESHSSGMTAVAAVLGLRTVEVLREEGAAVSAEELLSYNPIDPRRRSSPKFVWPIDVDCDGITDMAVAGLSESYVSRGLVGGSFGPREDWAPRIDGQRGVDTGLCAAASLPVAPCITGRCQRDRPGTLCCCVPSLRRL